MIACALALFALAAAPAEVEGPVFEATGKVLSVDEKNATVTVDHDAIPGFMPAMRMRFTVDHPEQLKRVKAGDLIRFTLGARGEEMVVLTIRPMPAPQRVSCRRPEHPACAPPAAPP
ncbi:MAG TPA: copper-binding protein [Anaeromyxobacteraceae bacterium]|nr:copper-binding protein [Anaeromyxobacteraceae bacterium]